MRKSTVFVGMDVHAETIAVAVAEGRDQARSLGTILRVRALQASGPCAQQPRQGPPGRSARRN
jgi:hypothetical protein